MTPDDLRTSRERPQDFAATLIRHAARRAPGSLCARLEEEWLADLTDRRGLWQRLQLALGCLWATLVIAADQLALEGARSAAVTAPDNTLVLGSHDPSFFSRRSIILLIILSFHALLIYALISGVAGNVVQSVLPHSTATVITMPRDDRTAILPPPIHAASLGIAKTTDLPRITPIDIGPTTDPTIIVDPPPVVTGGGVTTGGAATHVRHIGGPARGFPDTDDYYPAASRRSGEQGISTVQVCVDPSGRLTADPTLAQSSGVSRLDEGALRLARAGSGFYRSTSEDGHPVADCYEFRVRFTLAR